MHSTSPKSLYTSSSIVFWISGIWFTFNSFEISYWYLDSRYFVYAVPTSTRASPSSSLSIRFRLSLFLYIMIITTIIHLLYFLYFFGRSVCLGFWLFLSPWDWWYLIFKNYSSVYNSLSLSGTYSVILIFGKFNSFPPYEFTFQITLDPFVQTRVIFLISVWFLRGKLLCGRLQLWRDRGRMIGFLHHMENKKKLRIAPFMLLV